MPSATSMPAASANAVRGVTPIPTTTASHSTVDSIRLSSVDIDLLALAKDMDATILTDDYSIQNTAKFLGIKYKAVGLKAIKKLVKWNYKCLGCGKVFDKEMPDCPVCGSKLRTTRASR